MTTKSLQEILHTFVVSLHAYSNGKGNPSDYTDKKQEATQQIEQSLLAMLPRRKGIKGQYASTTEDVMTLGSNQTIKEMEQNIKDWCRR